MDEFSHTKTNTSSGSGIGFLVAAVIVVLVLLYALFAGGGGTPVDPATVGTTDQGAPALEETAPTQPVAPAVGE
ncbi:hypothetical protein [Roseobacter sp. CCS2]|uniref:hypothetical protein n=1 Tax=Roseobacter sp. CCS2 TaxID=391593 RepID=UPI0000F405C5|nr:hypothetical protein [Roseobacter sp. CCS2]EBA11448.1 hypothetical protein RCCS2_02278 [Roseobacter sp. CCS2]